MKIVINSNERYKKALTVMFKSLLKTGFREFDDVVVVISGAERDVPPRKRPIREITLSAIAHPVTVIRMKMDNYDFTGYNALNIYLKHPLVRAGHYLYLHDTVTFDSSFAVKYNNLGRRMARSGKNGRNSLFVSPSPHSNICVLGAGVVRAYGSNFATFLTKQDAIQLEFDSQVKKKSGTVKGITKFGKKITGPRRVLVSEQDLYATGHPRVSFYYEDLGVYKWILWGKNGDFTGHVVPN